MVGGVGSRGRRVGEVYRAASRRSALSRGLGAVFAAGKDVWCSSASMGSSPPLLSPEPIYGRS